VRALLVVGLALGAVTCRGADASIDASIDAARDVAELPDAPIAAEAQVFRTATGMLAIGPGSEKRRAAHPRGLARYRVLRTYPEAPPRIPHGLTPSEFREGACKACHERGGFSARFNAYVPVTPHPEMGACLQCHIGDAKLMAMDLPNTDPNSRCRQCHDPNEPRTRDQGLDWRPMQWVDPQRPTRGETPPPIPHDTPMRVNCLSCHAAPSAVIELQTTHPERTNCRQCHVQAALPPAPITPPSLRAPAPRAGQR
jgi:nitrate reductase cytochrome c-type subunit